MPNSVTMRGTRVVARSMSCPAPVLASPKTTISAAWPPSSGGKSYRVLQVETEPSTTIGRRFRERDEGERNSSKAGPISADSPPSVDRRGRAVFHRLSEATTSGASNASCSAMSADEE